MTPTEIPGVFTDRRGQLVDEYGVSLSFKKVRELDASHWNAVLDGGEIKEPADLLKAVALDPTLPLERRIKAAVRAAPYFSPRLISVAGTPDAPPISMEQIRSLPAKELDALEAALAKATELLDKASSR